MELNLPRDVKSNKKDFSRYIGSKRHTRKNAGLLLNGSGDKRQRKDQGTEYLLCLWLSAVSGPRLKVKICPQ